MSQHQCLCRYLGKIIMSTFLFNCNFNECRKSFHRAFNSTFACIGRKASDDVIIELVKRICIPVLLYASHVLPFISRDYKSFDYVIDRTGLFRRIFVIDSKDVVQYCRDSFGFASLNYIIADRRKVFFYNV